MNHGRAVDGGRLSAAVDTHESAGPSGDRAFSLTNSQGVLHAAVFDVAGHGAAAADVAVFLEHALNAFVSKGFSLETTVAATCSALGYFYGAQNMFASLFIAALHRHSLTYVSAGHPDALLVDDRAHRHLPATGPLLGIFADATFNAVTIPVSRSARLVVVTDGILDARGPRGGRLYERGFGHLASHLYGGNGAPNAGAIPQALQACGWRFDDDHAALVAAFG